MTLLEKVRKIAGEETAAILERTGKTPGRAKEEFEKFYLSIEPELELQMQAAAQGDQIAADNLNILRDRLIVKAGDIAWNESQEMKNAIIGIIVAVIKAAVL